MSKNIILVIGGSAAGMSAASQARRLSGEVEITVMEQSPYISAAYCGLPYYISGEIKDIGSLIVRTKEYFENTRNIRVLTETKALRIKSSSKTVEAENLRTGKTQVFPYSRLVIATGGRAAANAGGGCIFALNNMQDGIALKKFIDGRRPLTAAVIGGGMIGLETASSFRKLGMKVTVFEGGPSILPGFENEISGAVEKYLDSEGVQIIKSMATAENAPEGGVDIKTSSETRHYDMALVALGTKPEAGLGAGAGCETGGTGALHTNRKMQTSIPSIYAAGDCVELKNLVNGKYIYMPLGTSANKTGRVAGANAAGGEASFDGITASATGNIMEMTVARTGLTSKEAAGYCGDSESVVSESLSRAQYYPGSSKIITKLIFSKLSGQLLGAQMAGKEGVSKRIDVLAVCVRRKMTLRDIAGLDLTYAPPEAPVWDPVLRAANSALLKLGK